MPTLSDHFGRHPVGRALHETKIQGKLIENAGSREIPQFARAIDSQQDIGPSKIPVHEVLFMQIDQPPQNLRSIALANLLLQGAELPQEAGDRPPWHVLHQDVDQEGPIILLGGLEVLDNVRMAQRLQHCNLLLQFAAFVMVTFVREIEWKDSDGQQPSRVIVEPDVHSTAATRCDLPAFRKVDRVVANERVASDRPLAMQSPQVDLTRIKLGIGIVTRHQNATVQTHKRCIPQDGGVARLRLDTVCRAEHGILIP
mmetsp:Transcript_42983/g.69843  ORF Transcript_42983/g.69843 Transcript_42983/m.69843 type:complete len:256 (-) Transcript_42983:805-1572(-)